MLIFRPAAPEQLDVALPFCFNLHHCAAGTGGGERGGAWVSSRDWRGDDDDGDDDALGMLSLICENSST